LKRPCLTFALAAAALFAASAQAGLLAVLNPLTAEVYVDTAALELPNGPQTVPTPDFGGASGITDTFDFGPLEFPMAATLSWLHGTNRRPPFTPPSVVEDSWITWPRGEARIKFVMVTGVEEPPARTGLFSVSVSPNPVTAGSAALRLSCPVGLTAGTVRIYGSTGRLALEQPFDARGSDLELPLDLSRLPNGAYAARLAAGPVLASARILIAR